MAFTAFSVPILLFNNMFINKLKNNSNILLSYVNIPMSTSHVFHFPATHL